MRICDLTTGSGRLMRAAKRLRERWSETSDNWNDSTSQAFEKDFLQPLGPEVQLALAAVQRFAEVLEDAEKECDDRDSMSH